MINEDFVNSYSFIFSYLEPHLKLNERKDNES